MCLEPPTLSKLSSVAGCFPLLWFVGDLLLGPVKKDEHMTTTALLSSWISVPGVNPIPEQALYDRPSRLQGGLSLKP